MSVHRFSTLPLPAEPTTVAPDGSDVRVLLALDRGSMAHFTLLPGQVSKAAVHRTVEEIWYFVAGRGQMWRSQEGRAEVVEVGPGVCLTIPLGAAFQFRCLGESPLEAIGVTMPPWPGDDEAVLVPGNPEWAPT